MNIFHANKFLSTVSFLVVAKPAVLWMYYLLNQFCFEGPIDYFLFLKRVNIRKALRSILGSPISGHSSSLVPWSEKALETFCQGPSRQALSVLLCCGSFALQPEHFIHLVLRQAPFFSILFFLTPWFLSVCHSRFGPILSSLVKNKKVEIRMLNQSLTFRDQGWTQSCNLRSISFPFSVPPQGLDTSPGPLHRVPCGLSSELCLGLWGGPLGPWMIKEDVILTALVLTFHLCSVNFWVNSWTFPLFFSR